MKNKNLLALIIVLLLTGLYFLLKNLIVPDFENTEKNPYDLKLDSIGKIEKDKFGSYKSTIIRLNLVESKAIAVYNDKLFVSGDKMIQVSDKQGNKLLGIKTDKTATAITIDESGFIYAALEDHIEIYDTKGHPVKKFKKPNEKAYLTSAVVFDKNIFAADAEEELVYLWDLDGNILNIYGDSVPATDIMRFVIPSAYFDVDIAPDGTLWVANTGKHAIINVNKKGEVRSYWGTTSSCTEDFCGCCNPTHFSITSDGSFITSEKGIVRLKKYDSYGKFLHVIAGPEHFKEKSTGLDIAVDSDDVIYVLEPSANCIHVFKTL